VSVVKAGGTVIIFDQENGLPVTAERLKLLGLTEIEAERVHYYAFSSFSMDEGVVAAFEDLLDEVKPDLAVFDSWINLLAACDLDENSSVDIAKWSDAYPQKARRRDIAALILDHVPKDGGSARGSGRKLDYVDVMFELRNPQRFDRERVGRIDLHLRKDREGFYPSVTTFSVGGGENGFVFERSAGTATVRDEDGLLPRQRIALDALAARGGTVTATEWCRQAMTVGLSESTFYRAKRELEAAGHVLPANGTFSLATVTTVNLLSRQQMTVPHDATVTTVTPLRGDSMTVSGESGSDSTAESGAEYGDEE
jgi:hypothetical protein